MNIQLPDGLLAVLGMIAAWWLGSILSNLPSRLVRAKQPSLTVSELATASAWDAMLARSYYFVIVPLFFAGAIVLAYAYQAFFPGPIDEGFAFAFFGSLICLLGMARGAYEAALGVGPETHDLIHTNLPKKFLTDSEEVRRRGQLRVPLCAASMAFFFFVGGYCKAVLGPLLVLALVVYLVAVGPVHILDALRTFRKTRASNQHPSLVGCYWMFGSGVFFVFGAAHLVLAAYLLIRLFGAVW